MSNKEEEKGGAGAKGRSQKLQPLFEDFVPTPEGGLNWFMRLSGAATHVADDEKLLRYYCSDGPILHPGERFDMVSPDVLAGTTLCRVAGCCAAATYRFMGDPALLSHVDLKMEPDDQSHPILFTSQLVLCGRHKGGQHLRKYIKALPESTSNLFTFSRSHRGMQRAMLLQSAQFLRACKLNMLTKPGDTGRLSVRRIQPRAAFTEPLKALLFSRGVVVKTSHVLTQQMHVRHGGYHLLNKFHVHPDALHPAFPQQVAFGHCQLRRQATGVRITEEHFTPEFLHGTPLIDGSGKYGEMPPGGMRFQVDNTPSTFRLRTTAKRASQLRAYFEATKRHIDGVEGHATLIPDDLLVNMTENELRGLAETEGGICTLEVSKLGRQGATMSLDKLANWKEVHRVEELGPTVYPSLAHAWDMHRTRRVQNAGVYSADETSKRAHAAYRDAFAAIAHDKRPDRPANWARSHLPHLYPSATPLETKDGGMYIGRLDGPPGVRTLAPLAADRIVQRRGSVCGRHKATRPTWTHMRLQRRDDESSLGQWDIMTTYEAQIVYCEAWYQVLCDRRTPAGRSARALRKMLLKNVDVCIEGTDYLFSPSMVASWPVFRSANLLRTSKRRPGLSPPSSAIDTMARLLALFVGGPSDATFARGVSKRKQEKEACFTYELVLATYLLFGPLPTGLDTPHGAPSHVEWRKSLGKCGLTTFTRDEQEAGVFVPWDPRCKAWGREHERELEKRNIFLVEPKGLLPVAPQNPYVYMHLHADFRPLRTRRDVYNRPLPDDASPDTKALAKLRAKTMANMGFHPPWPAPVPIGETFPPTHVVRVRRQMPYGSFATTLSRVTDKDMEAWEDAMPDLRVARRAHITARDHAKKVFDAEIEHEMQLRDQVLAQQPPAEAIVAPARKRKRGSSRPRSHSHSHSYRREEGNTKEEEEEEEEDSVIRKHNQRRTRRRVRFRVPEKGKGRKRRGKPPSTAKVVA